MFIDEEDMTPAVDGGDASSDESTAAPAMPEGEEKPADEMAA